MAGNILGTVEDFVATLTFNNPDRHNAMSLEMWRQASATLEALAQDPNVRVIVLTGAGNRSFVSGADISRFSSERTPGQGIISYTAAVEQFSQGLLECSKPTIASIRGYCIGGGVNIAVCCDLRICTENSRFAIPAAKLGVGYGPAPVRRLMDVIGPQFAAEVLLTARQFEASQASQMGLVNRVVADHIIEEYVRDLAKTIAENAPLTILATKRIIRELLARDRVRDFTACDALIQQCFESADYDEGRRAFLEKRKPNFTGH